MKKTDTTAAKTGGQTPGKKTVKSRGRHTKRPTISDPYNVIHTGLFPYC